MGVCPPPHPHPLLPHRIEISLENGIGLFDYTCRHMGNPYMRSAGEFQFNQTKFLSHSFKKKIYISFFFFLGSLGSFLGNLATVLRASAAAGGGGINSANFPPSFPVNFPGMARPF